MQGITMDGHATNVTMCRLLGCDLNPLSLKTSFVDDANNTVYIYFDACHLVKLVRNMFEAYGLLESSHGQVKWNHIKDLEELQVSA